MAYRTHRRSQHAIDVEIKAAGAPEFRLRGRSPECRRSRCRDQIEILANRPFGSSSSDARKDAGIVPLIPTPSIKGLGGSVGQMRKQPALSPIPRWEVVVPVRVCLAYAAIGAGG